MKVIFENKLWVVIGDDGEGLQLESLGEPTERSYAAYADESLIVDPTDGEVDGVSMVSPPRSGHT